MKLAARGLDATLKAEIATYRAEARFLRDDLLAFD
jgi:hypothetical protein